MQANQLIDLIEGQGLLDPEVIAELRRQVEQSTTRISAEAIAKLLVENGQLTKFQATRLIAQLRDGTDVDDSPKTFLAGSKGNAAAMAGSSVDYGAAEEDSMLPEDLLPPSKTSPKDEIPEAVIITDAESVEIIDDELSEVDEFEEIFEEEDLDPVLNTRRKPAAASSTAFPTDSSEQDFESKASSRIVRPVKISSVKENQWDVFRIWGYGFILMTLLTAFGGLVYWVLSKSSESVYQSAQESYDARDYEKAIQQFKAFASSYSGDEKAGRAKILAAIAQIRQANDQLGDPVRAIEHAKELLPGVVNEPSMNDLELRADLAQAMVAVSEKLVQRADGAKTTEDRKVLIERLDEQFVLMKNPQYIPNAQRVTNEVRIRTVEEERERLLRNVRRAEDTVIAIDAMKAAIEKSDVNAAYQARQKVVRDYPQLALDKQLLELLQQATALQQKAVESTKQVPELIVSDETKNIARSILLVKQSGKSIDVPDDAVHVVKAKQSVYGLRAKDGTVLWRRKVGSETVSDPIRMSVDLNADSLLVSPSKGNLVRIGAADGKPLWELQFVNKLLAPSIDSEVVFASTRDGQVYAIDGETGLIRWAKQIPQNMDVGVGGGANKPGRYCLGEHSNLFVLSRNDGACKQVYYVGHNRGTVAVPPVFTLGYVLIFENAKPGECTMHILKAGDQGDELTIGQNPITLKGHVVVPPTIDGRRMVVVTDLGEVNAYDVEPANPSNKVNRVAGVEKNESAPRIAWPTVAGNELWIAANRFTRFQIQVSKQQLVRDWVREEEDQFTGRPVKIDDYLIHSRVVRGTQGIRVTAVDSKTGDPVWETDLGVPLVSVQASTASLSVINSQAALFAVSGKAIKAGLPIAALENPGRNNRAINFDKPVTLASGKTAMLNLLQGPQIVTFDPKGAPGSTLQMNTIQVSNGVPSQPPAVAGAGIVVPLDNAQLAYFDAATGKQLGSPYQPTLQTGVVTRWIAPTTLSDGQTVIAATNQNKIHRLSTGKLLRSLTEAPTPLPLVGRLATASDVVCAVGRGESQDVLEVYNGTDLTRIGGHEQDGRVSWGPYPAGERFLAYCETSGLSAIDLKGSALWATPLPNIALVGAPFIDDNEVLLSGTNGKLYRVDMTSGAIKAIVDLDEPLNGSASTLGPQLLIPGAEGLLLILPIESTRTSSPATAEVAP
jgi:outer membrane protein assembly factor BamB/TolA-binding protein